MADPWTTGLATIDAVFAERVPVQYEGAGLAGETVQAIRSEVPGDPFQGPGATTRRVTFEIPMSALPQRPMRNDRVTHGALVWSVIDVEPHGDIDRWIVTVEEAVL